MLTRHLWSAAIALGIAAGGSTSALAAYTFITPAGAGTNGERCTSGVQDANPPTTCPASPSGGYAGLWSIVQAIAMDQGGATATRVNDTGGPFNDQVWVALSGNSFFQRARYAGDNSTIGIFPGASGGFPGSYLQIAGVIGPANSLFLSSVPAGQNGNGDITATPVVFTPLGLATGTTFRFGLDDLSSGDFWSSLIGDNPDGTDHFVTWQLTGGSIPAGTFDFVVAIEDRPNSTSDHDFNDYVFEFRQVAPVVPEPASIAVIGSGLIGLWALRRRKSA